jgi:hypothetical protein
MIEWIEEEGYSKIITKRMTDSGFEPVVLVKLKNESITTGCYTNRCGWIIKKDVDNNIFSLPTDNNTVIKWCLIP